MDFLTLVRVVLRRWYVVVAVAILTAGSAIAVVVTAEAEYEAQAVVLLSGPSSGDAEALDQVVDPGIVAEVVLGAEVRSGLPTDVPYMVDVGGDGTILRVTAEDSSPEDVVKTVEAVMDAIAAEVQSRQRNAGIPEDIQTTTQFLRMPDEAVESSDGTQYTASGSVLFVPGGTVSTQPYPPDTYTLSLLQTWLASEDALNTLADRGAQAAYLASFDSRGAAPMLYIDVSGTAEEDPIQTMNLVIDLASEELEARQEQEGVPAAARTVIEDISVPTLAEKTSTGLLRPLVVVSGLGIIAAFALAILTEGMAQALSKRREATRADLRSRGNHVGQPARSDHAVRPVWSARSDHNTNVASAGAFDRLPAVNGDTPQNGETWPVPGQPATQNEADPSPGLVQPLDRAETVELRLPDDLWRYRSRDQ